MRSLHDWIVSRRPGCFWQPTRHRGRKQCARIGQQRTIQSEWFMERGDRQRYDADRNMDRGPRHDRHGHRYVAVNDAQGRTLAEGAWSAAKSSDRWTGGWRALLVSGRNGEYSGTWAADLDRESHTRLGRSLWKGAADHRQRKLARGSTVRSLVDPNVQVRACADRSARQLSGDPQRRWRVARSFLHFRGDQG